MKPLFLIGRILFGGFVLYNGINHFRRRKNLAQYAGSKHVPAPQAGVVISGLMLVAGGGPGQRMADLRNFSKNLALLGAALVLIAMKEPWPASVAVSRRTRNRVRRLVTRLAA